LRVAVLGTGAVAARTARQLASTDAVASVVVHGADPERVERIVASLGREHAEPGGTDPFAGTRPDAVILAGKGSGVDVARAALAAHVPVVSVSDAVDEVRALLELDAAARAAGVAVVVGAGFGPGLSCLLAAHAASVFDMVDEVHVARVGTAGPACARQHHDALSGSSVDWRDGEWVTRRGGSGRELCWFPEPIGAEDCYRAALPDALLLQPAFPGVQRVTARLAANRRDRVSAHLPMLRPPHPEGGLGAVRVEVRGRRGVGRGVEVLGAVDRPAVASGAVAALLAVAAVERRLSRDGAAGVAELAPILPTLAELARRGVKAAVFEGVS
jgi:saccharopine dehydrogenase-like NADP-dependent oxidoreductase